MNVALAQIINLVGNILILLIIADALLSFFMSPFHPIRQALGRILTPLYAPLRRIIPPLGMMDLTPLVLLIIIRVLQNIIVSLLI
jgi:YggT family protein